MGNAFVLIVVGLVLMYAVVSDKFYCLEGCFSCLAGRIDQKAGAGLGGSVQLPTTSPATASAGISADRLRGLF